MASDATPKPASKEAHALASSDIVDGKPMQEKGRNVTLLVEYADGSKGVLTIGCHGPGAPHGIFEGIATTKGYTTYYNVPDPALGVDAGRTNFHVR